MGKFMYAVLLMFGIELSLYLFGGTDFSNTLLFGMLFNPASIWTNAFYLVITAAIAIAIGATIIPGNFVQLNTIGLYAGIAAVLITFLASAVHLWSFINGSLTELSIESAQIVATVIVAPLIIFYIFAVSEWVRANQ